MNVATKNLLIGGLSAGGGAVAGGVLGGMLGATIAQEDLGMQHENALMAWGAIAGSLLGAGIAGGIASWQLAKATAAQALAAQNPTPAGGGT